MGLDRHAKTPCGFCFVEYCWRRDTEDAMRFLNGLKLDERIVRCDWDGGFVEGRQYGRGRSGGQVRDEYRADYDAERGGWGKAQDAPPPTPPAPAGRQGEPPALVRRAVPRPRRRPRARPRRLRARRRRRRRFGGGGGGRGGGDDDGEQSAKRTRTEEPEQKTRASARSATTTTTIRVC